MKVAQALFVANSPTGAARRTPYNSAFFSKNLSDSYRSARVLLPIVNRLVRPKQVIDVGCGVGTWLRAWEELGVSSVIGVDGTYVDRRNLQIDPRKFISMDLVHPEPVTGAPFDLAQSLEVGEHLPETAAAGFVSFLCSLSPIILFSAAIPDQGGTLHINEQWPEYWAEIFDHNGYTVLDVLRPEVWDSAEIACYYAQNAFLFVNKAHLNKYPELSAAEALTPKSPLARVHPRKWTERVRSAPRFEDLVSSLPASSLDLGMRILRRVRPGVSRS